ncbi:hypothetical protein P7B02_02895 [Caulobacter segnis]|nr:hypothetical protein [Caulobacter segnis]MDG2520476.1 hypothetical protein [Caulobacter segnis]
MVGLTFQQIRRTRAGAISACKLYQIAQALDVSFTWFFEGLASSPKGSCGHAQAVRVDRSGLDAILASDEGARLIANWRRVDARTR